MTALCLLQRRGLAWSSCGCRGAGGGGDAGGGGPCQVRGLGPSLHWLDTEHQSQGSPVAPSASSSPRRV